MNPQLTEMFGIGSSTANKLAEKNITTFEQLMKAIDSGEFKPSKTQQIGINFHQNENTPVLETEIEIFSDYLESTLLELKQSGLTVTVRSTNNKMFVHIRFNKDGVLHLLHNKMVRDGTIGIVFQKNQYKLDVVVKTHEIYRRVLFTQEKVPN